MNAGVFKRGRSFLKGAGPYLMLEMLLPGGTLLAVLLWLATGSSRGQPADVHRRVTEPVTIERVTCVCPSAGIHAAVPAS